VLSLRPLSPTAARGLGLGLAAAWLLAIGLPNWRTVQSLPQAQDYATYHYAAQVAAQGGDPYDKVALGRAARAEGTRRAVHPYFYPPPFLLGMLWSLPLDLATAYRAWYWFNAFCLVSLLSALRLWFGAPVLLLGGVALSLNPIADNLRMGQANLPLLLLTVLGLWRRSGLWLGLAGMAKMSPALFLPWWAARGWWRPFAVAAATAVALSLLALPLVGPSAQLGFYTEVLPSFASGAYNGLTVPISLPANHSVPDLLHQAWPGPDDHHLAPGVRLATSLLTLGLVGGFALLARRERDALGEACLAAALSVLLLVLPVYTYEHHLSLAVLPAVAVGTAWLRGRLGVGRRALAWAALLLPAYALVALPLRWLRELQAWTGPGAAHWLVQECKLPALLLLGIGCLAAGLRAPAAGAAPSPGGAP
jgi:alpha-1,2-mannosyltransferase